LGGSYEVLCGRSGWVIGSIWVAEIGHEETVKSTVMGIWFRGWNKAGSRKILGDVLGHPS